MSALIVEMWTLQLNRFVCSLFSQPNNVTNLVQVIVCLQFRSGFYGHPHCMLIFPPPPLPVVTARRVVFRRNDRDRISEDVFFWKRTLIVVVYE